MTSHASLDHAQGCLLGAFIGDAAGATLEFIGHKPSASEVEAALQMIGGGVWRVAPGQITDDGELTLALGRALSEATDYPRSQVARNYRRWMLSPPFDVGQATRGALGAGALDDEDLADSMAARALAHNAESKANGALMRIAPMGVWATRLDEAAAVHAAMADARLTHPNLACQWANAAYVTAIRHLLLQPGDPIGAVDAAMRVAGAGKDAGSAEVTQWLEDARAARLPECHPLAGFVKIAFVHAFHHLQCATSFDAALREVLLGGGDTDTNACIVGALLGALHGAPCLPDHMKQAVLTCDTSKGQPRPTWLQTGDALVVASALL